MNEREPIREMWEAHQRFMNNLPTVGAVAAIVIFVQILIALLVLRSCG